MPEKSEWKDQQHILVEERDCLCPSFSDIQGALGVQSLNGPFNEGTHEKLLGLHRRALETLQSRHPISPPKSSTSRTAEPLPKGWVCREMLGVASCPCNPHFRCGAMCGFVWTSPTQGTQVKGHRISKPPLFHRPKALCICFHRCPEEQDGTGPNP